MTAKSRHAEQAKLEDVLALVISHENTVKAL